MFQRTPLPAGGPVVYHPGQPIMAPAQPAYRALSLDEIAAQNGAADESPSLLHRVAQRRNAFVTALITVASITSFVGVVYWAHRQNIEAGGSGLPIEIKAPDTPHKVKPDDPKGQVIPNQDIDAYRRVDPNAVPVPAERLMPPPATPRMPAATAERAPPAPAGAPPAPTATPSPAASATTAERVPSTAPPATAAPARPPEAKPAEATAQPKISDTGSPSAIASIIDGLGGAAATGGGYRIQVAAEKSEDGAKATWARLQKTNGDVLGPLRMQATRVDQGAAKGVWYRVQAGPLDERQAKDACAKLKARGQDCVVLPPSRG